MAETTAAAAEAIRQHLRQIQVPTHAATVFKDECMFSFDTNEASGGLYISLFDWQAYGAGCLALQHKRCLVQQHKRSSALYHKRSLVLHHRRSLVLQRNGSLVQQRNSRERLL